MGREIYGFEDWCDSVEVQDQSDIPELINKLRQLPADDLQKYFELLFGRMTSVSKEAVTEILWTGLSPSEQQTFDMPFFGHRPSNQSVNTALQNAFNLGPRRAVTPVETSSTGTSTRMHETSPTSPSRSDRALEEQFFAILRNAIMRSERSSRPITARGGRTIEAAASNRLGNSNTQTVSAGASISVDRREGNPRTASTGTSTQTLPNHVPE